MGKRLSIAEVMTVILLSAIDFRAIRSILDQEGGPTDLLLSTAGMLVVNVLAVGMLALRRRLRRGESAPFLVAFEAVGGSSLLIYMLGALLYPVVLLDHFKVVWSPYIRYMASLPIGRTRYFLFMIELAILVHFALVLLVPAMIVGLRARSRRIDRSIEG